MLDNVMGDIMSRKKKTKLGQALKFHNEFDRSEVKDYYLLTAY